MINFLCTMDILKVRYFQSVHNLSLVSWYDSLIVSYFLIVKLLNKN